MRARPLPKERARQARSELYRQLILEAAERTFASKGVEETRMEAIAAESGLSLGTPCDNRRTIEELGVRFRPTAATLRDAIRWMLEAGHLEPRYAPRLTGVL